MNELALDLNVTVTPQEIKYDLTPIKTMIESVDGIYKDWVVKKEDLPTAKVTMAQLNKLAKTLSDKRLEVVRNFKKPLDEFENEIKALCTTLTDRSSTIKTQTEIFEKQAEEEKRKVIMGMPQYKPYIKFDERWLNKTFAIESVLLAIEVQTAQYEKSYQAIKAVCEKNNLESTNYLNELEQGIDFDKITDEIAHDYNFLKSVGAPVCKAQFKPNKEEKTTMAFGEKLDESITTISIKVVGKKYQLEALKRIAKEELGLTVIE